MRVIGRQIVWLAAAALAIAGCSSGGDAPAAKQTGSATASAAGSAPVSPAGWVEDDVTFVADGLTIHGTYRHPGAAALVAPLIGSGTRVVISHDVEHGLAEADLVLGLRGGRVALLERASAVTAADVRALYA